MARLTIQRKVFLATLVLTTTLIVLLASVVRWNLGQGFAKYATEAEFARLEWLIKSVEAAYAENGNWDFVKADPERVWRRLSRPGPAGGYESLASEGERGRSETPPPRPPPKRDDANASLNDDSRPMLNQERPPRTDEEDRDRPRSNPPRMERLPPANDMLRIGPRLSLLDAEGKRLAGNANAAKPGALRPIRLDGAVVGHLALEAAPTSARELDAAFLASQTSNLFIAGLAALGLSLIAAWLLARHLLEPIRDLGAGAQRIADGGFDTQIPVRSDDELGELAGNFNVMAMRLAKAEESRRAWISDASHELRTPLAVLRAEIEALQDGIRTADAATLARLHRQVQQLATLVDDLRLSLDETPGTGALETCRISPVAVLEETIAAFRERYAAAGIAIDVTGTRDDRLRVLGDAGRLAQVFSNLLENTLRYTDSGGRLQISLAVRNRKLIMLFDDTAPAPPRAALPHLFERFYRAEPSRSRALGGSGLGLAICKTLVDAHGGRISASQSALGGLCIRMELPLETT